MRYYVLENFFDNFDYCRRRTMVMHAPLIREIQNEIQNDSK